MTPEQFVARVPRLFHMAQDGSWESIQHYGLLSTSALLDLFEVEGPERECIESARRPESVRIHHARYGTAVVRDNRPMNDRALRRCLVAMEPREWYELLNRRCFFWCSGDRLRTMLKARPYREQAHVVLTLDSAALLRSCADQASVTYINTGATLYDPPKRGRHTFVPLVDAPDRLPVELVVPGGVADVRRAVVRVDRMQGESCLGTLCPD